MKLSHSLSGKIIKEGSSVRRNPCNVQFKYKYLSTFTQHRHSTPPPTTTTDAFPHNRTQLFRKEIVDIPTVYYQYQRRERLRLK